MDTVKGCYLVNAEPRHEDPAPARIKVTLQDVEIKYKELECIQKLSKSIRFQLESCLEKLERKYGS